MRKAVMKSRYRGPQSSKPRISLDAPAVKFPTQHDIRQLTRNLHILARSEYLLDLLCGWLWLSSCLKSQRCRHCLEGIWGIPTSISTDR
jgi:hypothetical protein